MRAKPKITNKTAKQNKNKPKTTTTTTPSIVIHLFQIQNQSTHIITHNQISSVKTIHFLCSFLVFVFLYHSFPSTKNKSIISLAYHMISPKSIFRFIIFATLQHSVCHTTHKWTNQEGLGRIKGFAFHARMERRKKIIHLRAITRSVYDTHTSPCCPFVHVSGKKFEYSLWRNQTP